MCGRYTLTFEEVKEIEDFLNAWDRGVQLLERDGYAFAKYNGGPSTIFPVCYVNEEGERVIDSKVWWYHMFKPRDGKINWKYSMFNARKDQLYERSSWKHGFVKHQRRCIIPMSGFTEFTGPKGGKTCHYFTPVEGKFWAAAGIWSPVSHKDGVGSFTIILDEPNSVVEKGHDRMPVFLHESEFDDWLNPEHDDKYAFDMMQIWPAEATNHRIIAPEASNPRNDYKELLEPSTLF